MTTDIIEINNFIVLIEQSNAEKPVVERCELEEQVIGFSFYGSGNVDLEINYGNRKKNFKNSTGMSTSFYANKKVEFVHKISHDKPLQCVSIFSTIKNLSKLPEQENKIIINHFSKLIKSDDDFVAGPVFFMTPDMQNAVIKILSTQYEGATRIMFLRSQVMELLSHFFALLIVKDSQSIKIPDLEKLYQAKEIISKSIDSPPSLAELSKLIGLNSYKLKKNFKELFGLPVFKYLQNERLNKAHELLSSSDMSVQQVALLVGYESLSSFSSAFFKKFSFRPSSLKK